MGALVRVLSGNNQSIFRMLLCTLGCKVEYQKCQQADDHHAREKAKKDLDGKSWIRHNFHCHVCLQAKKSKGILENVHIDTTKLFSYHNSVLVGLGDIFTVRISTHTLSQGSNGGNESTQAFTNQVGI